MEWIFFGKLIPKIVDAYNSWRFWVGLLGVSHKQSLEHILNVDLSASIDFAVKSHPGIIDLQILLLKEKSRINILSKQ